MTPLLPLLFACASGPEGAPPPPPPDPLQGSWRVVLEVPGGDLPFLLDVEGERATVHNGPERLVLDSVQRTEGGLVLGFDRYDATIELTVDGEGLSGVWHAPRAGGAVIDVPVRAARGQGPRFRGGPPEVDVTGRWQVRFSSDEVPAVGEFQQAPDGAVTGTIRTATGDYRYLAGQVGGRVLHLSTFDGSHAFLFRATVSEQGTLAGDFWSGTWWHETWSAERDEGATLPDASTLTAATDVPLASLSFPDLQGVSRSLADPAFGGKARLIEVFGSWCPNCNDATRWLVDLDARYRDKGLAVVAVAFERTGDPARDVAQLQRYVALHGIRYPVLLGGTQDKASASAAFPLLDAVRAYPTLVLLDGEGRVQHVHTGFDGPATGEAHDRLVADLTGRIEALLAAP